MDQLRYLENRAKHEAHNKMIAAGQLPAGLPPGFEVTGPPQPTPQIPVPPSQVPDSEKDANRVSPGVVATRSQTPGQAPPSQPGQYPPAQYGQQQPFAGHRPAPQFSGPPGYQNYPPQGKLFLAVNSVEIQHSFIILIVIMQTSRPAYDELQSAA